MPITSRFVVRSTIGLLAVGFLALFGIVGMTIWLGERAQVYFDEVIEARDTRGVGGRAARRAADREIEPARIPGHRQRDLSRALRQREDRRRSASSTR